MTKPDLDRSVRTAATGAETRRTPVTSAKGTGSEMRRALFVALLLALALPVGAGKKPDVTWQEGFHGEAGCIHIARERDAPLESWCLAAKIVKEIRARTNMDAVSGVAVVNEGGDYTVISGPQPSFSRGSLPFPTAQPEPLPPVLEASCTDDLNACASHCSDACDANGHGEEVCKVAITQQGTMCSATCCGSLTGAICFCTTAQPPP